MKGSESPEMALPSAPDSTHSAVSPSVLGAYWLVVKRAAIAWIDDDAPSMGAALAFYTAFSIAPLLVIVIAVAGAIFGVEPARNAIIEQLGELLGPVGADAIKHLLQTAAVEGSGLVPSIVSLVLLLVGATTVLVELQADLDKIWDAPPRAEGGLTAILRTRLYSLGLILGFGFLLIASLVVAGGIAALAHNWRISISGARLLHALDFLASIAVFTVLFAMLFKWLPNVSISWRDLWIGSLITSLLFNIGRLGIGLFLGRSATASAYAAAGSLVVLLLWLYYSAQIFLFGAELTWSHARLRRSARPQPP
jgi:membrane protein